ncbi:MAG: DUF5984 family protein [Leptolyngbya sp. BL-A-14]
MLFDFNLRPIDSVTAWGKAPDLCFHWFGLTEGFYRLFIAYKLV